MEKSRTCAQGAGIATLRHSEYSLDEAVRLIKRDSRHFAKRQLTWFRREKNVIWIDADSFADRQKMSDTMEEMIRTRLHLPQ